MYLRPYEARDFERLYQLDVACFERRFRFSRALMREVVEGEGAVCLLACEEDGDGREQVTGFGAAELREEADLLLGYIATLDVDPAWRRRGVGERLVRELEGAMARLGAAWMILHVYAGNPGAQRLYERLGYSRADRISGFYGRGHDAWLYRKAFVADGAEPGSSRAS